MRVPRGPDLISQGELRGPCPARQPTFRAVSFEGNDGPTEIRRRSPQTHGSGCATQSSATPHAGEGWGCLIGSATCASITSPISIEVPGVFPRGRRHSPGCRGTRVSQGCQVERLDAGVGIRIHRCCLLGICTPSVRGASGRVAEERTGPRRRDRVSTRAGSTRVRRLQRRPASSRVWVVATR